VAQCLPVREEIVTGPCGTKAKSAQKWLERLPYEEHTASGMDYHNPYMSNHPIAEKKAQISRLISAMITYEL